MHGHDGVLVRQHGETSGAARHQLDCTSPTSKAGCTWSRPRHNQNLSLQTGSGGRGSWRLASSNPGPDIHHLQRSGEESWSWPAGRTSSSRTGAGSPATIADPTSSLCLAAGSSQRSHPFPASLCHWCLLQRKSSTSTHPLNSVPAPGGGVHSAGSFLPSAPRPSERCVAAHLLPATGLAGCQRSWSQPCWLSCQGGSPAGCLNCSHASCFDG